MPATRLPALQFYPGDWLKDPAIRSLSLEERGAWFEILLLMHESPRRGVLLLGKTKMGYQALANALGITPKRTEQIIKTLLDNCVCDLDKKTGAIVNRRMLKDERLRKARAKAGKKGGEAKGKQTPSKTKAKRGSSSSSSASSSASTSEGEEKIPPPPPKDLGIEFLIKRARKINVIANDDTLRRWVEGWVARCGKAKVEQVLMDPSATGKTVVEIHDLFFKKSNGKAKRQGDPECSDCRGSGNDNSTYAPGSGTFAPCHCVKA